MQSCRHCQVEFDIPQEDLDFYKKVSPIINEQKYLIPSPTLCPDCRQQRRLAWRNQNNVYISTCSGTQENIFTAFNPECNLPVYKNEYWYSDNWDPKDYGRDFDFSRPFFEQYAELIHDVPQMALSNYSNENCNFTNQCGFCKDCYLIFEGGYNQDCYYSNNISNSRSCVDCCYISECELCYQCVNTENCYNLHYSQNCENCSDSRFLKDCLSCKNCFGCVNLKNKEYYFYNQALSKEDYEQKIKAYNLGSYQQVQELKTHFTQFKLQFPHEFANNAQNENCNGNYIFNSKDCQSCFDLVNSQNCKYVYNHGRVKDSYDICSFQAEKGIELCYENHSIGHGANNVLFSDDVWIDVYNILYSRFCIQNSHDLFGCAGLKHSSYCILNKQYTKEEYEKLVPQIIEHMKSTGEWGEFMPAKYSVYGYNESEAQDYFPLTHSEAQSKGYKWYDKTNNSGSELKEEFLIPDDIQHVESDICLKTLSCHDSDKNYKIIPQELEFYKNNQIPVPRKSYFIRYKTYMQKRNPRELFDRHCTKCQTPIQTTFSPNRPETVYCAKCFQDALK